MGEAVEVRDLVDVRIALSGGARAHAWLDGSDISLTPSIARRVGVDHGSVLRVAPGDGTFDQRDAFEIRDVALLTSNRPGSARLPVSYQVVPSRVRSAVGRMVGMVQRRRQHLWARFPRWPIDLTVDAVTDLSGHASRADDGPTPVLLSHDLDSAEGLRNLVDRFLGVEERFGARSTNYIVPCAWPIDHGLLGEVAARGHEVGVHGYDHSHTTPFAPPLELAARLDAALAALQGYRVVGYRAPSLIRTAALLDGIAGRFGFDSSIPTSGGLFPSPNNGCATARPFQVGDLWELPITLPRDGSMRFMGYGPEEMLRAWQACSEVISRSHGVVHLLTHCERRFSGSPSLFAAYERFVGWLAEDPRFVFAAAADVVRAHSGDG